MTLPPDLARRIDDLAANRDSGASDILDVALGVLGEARSAGADLTPVARAICSAQPGMAPLWNAALAAVADGRAPGRFDQFAERVRRAPAALARFAVDALSLGARGGPVRLVTISFSRSVLTVFDALRSGRSLHVSCAESRPALEGRRLASTLAGAGVPVTCYADGAIGRALEGADAMVVGADAVGPDWFLNKTGTRMLAALAATEGVPVYVVASRDKFVGRAIASRLAIPQKPPAEVWDNAPAGVEVRNLYFEPTPLDLVTSVITDVGVLGSGTIPDVCESAEDDALRAALADLGL